MAVVIVRSGPHWMMEVKIAHYHMFLVGVFSQCIVQCTDDAGLACHRAGIVCVMNMYGAYFCVECQGAQCHNLASLVSYLGF